MDGTTAAPGWDASSSSPELSESNPNPVVGAEVFVELSAPPRHARGKSSSISSPASSSGRTHTTPVQIDNTLISKPAGLWEVLNKLQMLQQAESLSPCPSPASTVAGCSPTQAPAPPHHVLEVVPRSAPKPLILLEFSDLTYTVYKRNGSWWPRFGTTRTRSSGSDMAVNPLSTPEAARAEAILPQEERKLLQAVSGQAREGEILAVMGPSGSGKSTLIDALAMRISKGSLRGSLTLNGEEISARLLRNISAYVMQDDLLFPMLTVYETLMFSANVRLPPTYSKDKKVARVKTLLDQLGLQGVANTIIGDEGRRGVSGGERRRVSIGIDIVHDPLLLFLDEPTSGLDSTSAFMVVRTLQKIAQTGSIVILSIHQPSYRIMGLLDRLVFLAHGQTVYNGPPSQLGSFFMAYGRPVPEHENSTEFALDLIQELHCSESGIKPLVEFSKEWVVAAAKLESRPSVDIRTAVSLSISKGKLVAARTQGAYDCGDGCRGNKVAKYATPLWAEMLVITKRTIINVRRTPELFLMRLGTVVVTGFVLATIFWRLDHSPKGSQERLGFLAFAVSTTFYTCADALPVFLQERYIFMRETAHNAYRKSSYVLANAMVYVPFLGLLSLAFSASIWWTVGLSGGWSGFAFLFLILWSSFWAGNSFVTFLSAIIPNVMVGYTVVVAMLAYFVLLSGFFIARDRIPKYWLWFHYLSMIKYPYEAVLINEFGGRNSDVCFQTGRQIFYGTPLEKMNATVVSGMLKVMRHSLVGTAYAHVNSTTCLVSGRDILERLCVTQLGRWSCLGVTLGFGVLFRILFYAALRRTGHNKRV